MQIALGCLPRPWMGRAPGKWPRAGVCAAQPAWLTLPGPAGAGTACPVEGEGAEECHSIRTVTGSTLGKPPQGKFCRRRRLERGIGIPERYIRTRQSWEAWVDVSCSRGPRGREQEASDGNEARQQANHDGPGMKLTYSGPCGPGATGRLSWGKDEMTTPACD